VLITLHSHVLKIAVLDELETAIHSACDAQRIVITGTNGYFAAGADISELHRLTGVKAFEYARRGQNVLNSISRSAAITIAAIDGYCMGGALDLALSCDLRYGTSRSVLAHPGGRIGIMTGWGGTRRLPLIIGRTRALELMAGGRWLSADEAAQWGLLNSVVEDPVSFALNLTLCQ
jgi:enoyl-CoA hydratase